MQDVFTAKKPSRQSDTPPNEEKKAFHPVTIMKEKPQRHGFFTAFAPKPIGLKFETQEPEEEIVLLVRKHFITNFPWILIVLFFVLLSFILFPFLRSNAFSDMFFIPDTYLLILAGFYYLIVIGFALQQFTAWFYQMGIITNYRVIDIDFHTLISRNVAYTDISDIVDLEISQGGFLHNFLNYGNVHIQTEGLKANFEFLAIPKPHIVADTISDLIRVTKGQAS